MTLLDRPLERFRPWHALMLVVFLAGAGLQLARGTDLFPAVLAGLFGLVVFQYTVGNVWGYAVEYRNAGGGWRDLPFLLPFVAAGVVAAGVFLGVDYVPRTAAGVATALWVGFWVFVLTAGVVAVAVWGIRGYREGALAEPSQRSE